MNPEQLTTLQNTANKLRMMWGNNPDSLIIEEAIKALSTKAPAEDESTAPKTIARKKG